MTPYRIAIFPGGGARFLIQALTADRFERETGKPLHKAFDLLVGTSAGALVAMMAGLGMTGASMLAFYQEHATQIFQGKRSFLRRIFQPAYSAENLKRAAIAAFEGRRLRDCKTRVMVCSTQRSPLEAVVDKSWKGRGEGRACVDVALQTAAAPTYFPAHRGRYDGGLWANHPYSVAVEEVRKFYDRGTWSEDRGVEYVYFGNGQDASYVPPGGGGLLYWISPRRGDIIGQLMTLQGREAAYYFRGLGARGYFLQTDLDLALDRAGEKAQGAMREAARKIAALGDFKRLVANMKEEPK